LIMKIRNLTSTLSQSIQFGEETFGVGMKNCILPVSQTMEGYYSVSLHSIIFAVL
jgi:hypothetical protein